jgi:molybdate transport system ATP-binding protein/molybdate transport system permease protein
VGAPLTVPLEVQIAKRLADFTLDVSFSAGDEPLSVLGPSGAGKSMLLKCIAGLERPDRGRVVLNGRVLLESETKVHLPARERRIGMLFQHYGLFPHRTLAANIAFGIQDLPEEDRRARVSALVQRMHIAGLEDRYPRRVSGGEQQRAALARALAIEPEALLLDEPLSALDTHLRSQMEAELQQAFDQYARPSLLVTHNIEEAYRLGKRLLVLSRGKVAAFGAKDEIFLRPPNLEVARVTGCKNFSRVRMIDRQTVEAVEWNCQLRVQSPVASDAAYAGIRANHIRFADAGESGSHGENVFPCWLVRASETPFRVTLYLRLGPAVERNSEFQLQAEVTREKWSELGARPMPWKVILPPQAIFVMPE